MIAPSEELENESAMWDAAGTGIPLPPSTPAPSGSNAGTDVMYASMGLSAFGSLATAFSQSSAIKAQGAYEASIANANASIAKVQASQVLEAGDVEASRRAMKGKADVATELAAQGASGVDVASGSSALTRNATQGVSAIDQLTIKNNAARQAWGYQTEAIESTYKGQFAQLTAATQAQQSLMTGGLQALSGPLAIESNYLRWSRYMGGGGTGGKPFPNAS